MTTPSDSAPQPVDLDALRAQILSNVEDPAETPEDFARVAAEARRAIATGSVRRRPSALRVRLFGLGVLEHEIPVHSAARILDALQGAVTATGEAVRRKGALPATSKDAQRTTAEATELFLSPRIAPGSVVFFLEAREKRPAAGGQLVNEDVDGLVDVAVQRLFDVLDLAGGEEVAERQALEESMRDLGVRAASRIAGLANASLQEDVEVDLALRTPRGRRAKGTLTRRTSVALQHAFAQASDRVERHQLVGILHTVSDGADPLRMEVEGQRPDIRLAVEAQVGAGLGPLLGRRISADVEVTVKWQAASGRETRSYRLLHAEAAQPAQPELPPG